MRELRYTLVADGTSDASLIPLLSWVLRERGLSCPIRSQLAKFDHIIPRPSGLADRIVKAVKLFECELLFVHRDAENQGAETRISEIRQAESDAARETTKIPLICVVPIRMTEAWLLFDEAAIRRAAGNPNGRAVMDLPRMTQLEDIPDPKAILHNSLRLASELRGRHLHKFKANLAARRVAQNIDDFAPLRSLSAFRTLESDIEELIRVQGWHDV